jgi:signal-transduction protein with cAMP-binding, CBS, and nucleotidyltransferase domain
MKTGIKVGDIMTRNFVSVKPTSNLAECSKEMVNKRVGSLIVKEGQKLSGMVTEKDILRALVHKSNFKKTRVKEVMAKKLTTIAPSKDIYNAMLKMKKSQIRWLPVVVDGRVIGMITMKDILKIQPTLLDLALQHWQIKEEEQKWKRVKGTGTGKWFKEGACDECGAFDLLYKLRNKFVCESCKESLNH